MVFSSLLTPFAKHCFEMDAIQKLYKVKTLKHPDMFKKMNFDQGMSTILTHKEQEDVQSMHEISNISYFCCLNESQKRLQKKGRRRLKNEIDLLKIVTNQRKIECKPSINNQIKSLKSNCIDIDNSSSGAEQDVDEIFLRNVRLSNTLNLLIQDETLPNPYDFVDKDQNLAEAKTYTRSNS